MLYRLVRPMRRKGSRKEYFQQRIPADLKQAAIGRRLTFLIAGEAVSFAATERSHAIKFSLRSSDPAEVKLRQAEAARQAELHWKALRQTKAVTLSHRQCVALSRQGYQAWASGARETTVAVERVLCAEPHGSPSTNLGARDGRQRTGRACGRRSLCLRDQRTTTNIASPARLDASMTRLACISPWSAPPSRRPRR
jgi:hypothetical protein